MINLIIEFKGAGGVTGKRVDDFESIIEALLGDFKEDYTFYYSEIPEMKDDTYLILIKRGDDFIDLLKRLKRKRGVKIIGAYKKNGKPYIYKKANGDNDNTKNHSILKYRKQLRKIKQHDDDGNVISERDHTEEEARGVQVNKIYGDNDREL